MLRLQPILNVTTVVTAPGFIQLICSAGSVINAECIGCILLGIAVTIFKIYRDNYQASLLVTADASARTELTVK